MKIEDAVKTLVEELKMDEGYRISWQANIAMAFADEYTEQYNGDPEEVSIHEVANNAADNFLNLLCRDVTENEENNGN